MKTSIKIAYFGTGDFSRNILKDLCENFSDGIEVKLVVSQPDKAIGRKRIITPTPVHAYADKNNLNILQPKKLKNKTPLNPPLSGREEAQIFQEKLESLDLDFIVVVAYGKIIPKAILDIPKYGCINIHGSILPDYRGASPIQESLKNGDSETGLTIMYMSEGMDEGDVLNIRTVEIDKLDKTPDMFTKFEQFGAGLLVENLEGIISGDIVGKPQDDSRATYCSKVSKSDGEIDFKTMTSEQIYNRFRAYYPWPGIYVYYRDKKLNLEDIIYVNDTAPGFSAGITIKSEKRIGIVCADNRIIQLAQVKLEGKKSMDILSFINGNKDFLDYKF